MFSFRYVLRETGQNLWRNILLAVATVITVGVSLAMFGASCCSNGPWTALLPAGRTASSSSCG